MNRIEVNEYVQEWIKRFASDDEDRCLEQSIIGKVMAFLVMQSNCGYLDKEEAFSFFTSLSNYMDLLSNVEPK